MRPVRPVFFLLAMAYVLVLPDAAHAQAIVVLNSEVYVRDATLRLADVADIRGEDSARAGLANVFVGNAPGIGQQRLVTRQELQHWIDTDQQQQPDVIWQGGAQVLVRRMAEAADEDAAVAVAAQALTRALSARFHDFSIVPAGAPFPHEFPLARYRIEAKPLVLPEALPKRVVVWIDLWEGRRFYRSLPVAFTVTATAEVLRAHEALAAGQQLGAVDFMTQVVDVTTVAGPYWPAEASLDGLRLRSAVAAGGVLLKSAVQAQPMVERGQLVAVRVQAGMVLVEGRGQALQDGWAGRIIPVMPSNATEEIRARVIATGVVEVISR